MVFFSWKSLPIALAASLLLTSCFGSTSDNVNLTGFEGKGFTMQVPKTWVQVTGKDLPQPKSGSIAGAFTSPDISSGFANNLLVLKDVLGPDADSSMTSRKYSVVNQALTTGKYIEYTKLSDKKISFPDNDEGLLVQFEAKYNNDTPKQKFLQAAKICGKDIYLLTIGLALSTNNTDKYQEIFESFTCK